MPLNSLIVGPFLPNHYCNPLALAICTRASLDSLPVYLEKAGRQKELLNVLSPAALIAMAQQSESFLPLQDRCELGLKTALALKRYDDSLRFQLQSAVAADISRFEFAEAEVVARLSLDDYGNALRIAQTAV